VSPRPGPGARRLVVLVLALLALAPVASLSEDAVVHSTAGLPEFRAADPAAAVVTEADLLARERFWPYHVALRRAWRASAEAKPLPAGTEGVLIRAEPSGRARIDFGRLGLHEVPVGETDLVERANRVRLGELEKSAPNLIYSIAPRLADSASEEPRLYPFPAEAEARRVACVFVDPSAVEFDEIARALGPLREQDGVLTIVFPQGQVPDLPMRERLRGLGWTVPFVLDHLAEPYTGVLLSAGIRPPAVLVATSEGRVLLESAWRRDLAPEIAAALDAGPTVAAPAP
jgi:hypothetical protein